MNVEDINQAIDSVSNFNRELIKVRNMRNITRDKWGRLFSENPAYYSTLNWGGDIIYHLKQGYKECGCEDCYDCTCIEDLYEDNNDDNEYLLLLIS